MLLFLLSFFLFFFNISIIHSVIKNRKAEEKKEGKKRKGREGREKKLFLQYPMRLLFLLPPLLYSNFPFITLPSFRIQCSTGILCNVLRCILSLNHILIRVLSLLLFLLQQRLSLQPLLLQKLMSLLIILLSLLYLLLL